jgi:hypothetical protein
VSLGLSQPLQSTAIVTGLSNTSVTWSIAPANLGSINSATGLYIAPAQITTAQPVIVTATRVSNPTLMASSQISFYSPAVAGEFPLGGSFLNFYRDMPQPLWAREFGWMQGAGVRNVVIAAVASLQANSGDRV